jgi:hypothetical protein
MVNLAACVYGTTAWRFDQLQSEMNFPDVLSRIET